MMISNDSYLDFLAGVARGISQRKLSKWVDKWFIPRPRFEDGNPVKRGDETTWGVVDEIAVYPDGSWSLFDDCNSDMWCGSADQFVKRPVKPTHKEPDTQEKIDDDKKKFAENYWGCKKSFCEKCPSLIDKCTPKDYYGVHDCSIAQGLDIARRQAELDARMGKD